MSTERAVRQLRLVVEADDYEAAVTFFRDALGLQSLNARLDAPAGLHITLFQQPVSLDERSALDGFGSGRDAAG